MSIENPAWQRPFYADQPGQIAIAHAGGNGAGIENQNTREAFETAAKASYLYLEVDVASTKDAKPLVYHGALKLGGLEKLFPTIQTSFWSSIELSRK